MVVQLDIAMVQEFQLRKEFYVIIQLLTHFRKKTDSCKSENKQVISGLVVISDIIDEYDVEFFYQQGHIKMKPKGISGS